MTFAEDLRRLCCADRYCRSQAPCALGLGLGLRCRRCRPPYCEIRLPLEIANSKTEPYIIRRQEIWVKYGDAVFEVEPAKNTVDALKKDVKAHWESNNDGKLNSDKLTVRVHMRKEVLSASTQLEGNTEGTAENTGRDPAGNTR